MMSCEGSSPSGADEAKRAGVTKRPSTVAIGSLGQASKCLFNLSHGGSRGDVGTAAMNLQGVQSVERVCGRVLWLAVRQQFCQQAAKGAHL